MRTIQKVHCEFVDVVKDLKTQGVIQLALMGYATDSDNPKKTAWEQFSSNIAVAVICLATNRKFNFSRMIFDHMRYKLQQHTRFYFVPSLTMKVFSNMKRSTKGFSGQEVPLFPTMLDATEPSPSPSRITSSPSPTPTPSQGRDKRWRKIQRKKNSKNF
ncbi:hypothetical protein Tco_0160792 [Tanacetum coccineum]